jgi:hypothetical protein
MTVKELIAALQLFNTSQTVIVRLGDSLNVYEVPVGGLTEVSYCMSFMDIVGDTYKVDYDAELKKCSGCALTKVDLCKQTDGIGQYMVHALLIDGGERSEGIPTFNDYIEVMTKRGLSWTTGKPILNVSMTWAELIERDHPDKERVEAIGKMRESLIEQSEAIGLDWQEYTIEQMGNLRHLIRHLDSMKNKYPIRSIYSHIVEILDHMEQSFDMGFGDIWMNIKIAIEAVLEEHNVIAKSR